MDDNELPRIPRGRHIRRVSTRRLGTLGFSSSRTAGLVLSVFIREEINVSNCFDGLSLGVHPPKRSGEIVANISWVSALDVCNSWPRKPATPSRTGSPQIFVAWSQARLAAECINGHIDQLNYGVWNSFLRARCTHALRHVEINWPNPAPRMHFIL